MTESTTEMQVTGSTVNRRKWRRATAAAALVAGAAAIAAGGYAATTPSHDTELGTFSVGKWDGKATADLPGKLVVTSVTPGKFEGQRPGDAGGKYKAATIVFHNGDSKDYLLNLQLARQIVADGLTKGGQPADDIAIAAFNDGSVVQLDRGKDTGDKDMAKLKAGQDTTVHVGFKLAPASALNEVQQEELNALQGSSAAVKWDLGQTIA